MIANYIQSFSQEVQNRFKDWVNNSEPGKLNRLSHATMTGVLTKFVGQAIPFATRNGFKVVDVQRGYVKALMPFDKNKNHFNAMYAGALFTVAELPGGVISLLSFDERFFPILVDLKMEYIKMAKTDVTVEFSLSDEELERIETETLKEGKGEFSLQGKLKDLNGEVVARSFANYQVRIRK